MTWQRFWNLLRDHRRFWRIAFKLAWRDLQSSRAKVALIVITLAISIAGVGGVYSAAAVAREAFQIDERAWLAGDLAVDLTDPIGEEQLAALERRKPEGLDWTVMSTTLTTSSSDQAPDPAMIAVKAIDPLKYPFYGAIALSPGLSLVQALRADTVAVSQDVLERLEVQIGDTIRVAGRTFRISSLILVEPDRLSGGLGLSMRCILSREGYARSGIERSGNSVKNRVLVRLPPGSDIEGEHQQLSALFPGGSARDYRGTNRQHTETAISFLSTTAFLALTLGAIGAATSVRQYAEQCLPTFAIMRILGAGNAQMAAIFFLQIGAMAVAAVGVALPLGCLATVSILSLTGNYLAMSSAKAVDFGALAWSLFAGLAAMAPVLTQPALLIRNLRPAILLRYEAERPNPAFPAAVRSAVPWISAAVACMAFILLASRMLRVWNSALLLATALAISALLAFLLAVFSLRLTKRYCSHNTRFFGPILRHGIAGLYRPRNRSRTLLTALATAVTVMLATFAASGTLTQTVSDVIPYDRNTLYIAGFKDSGRDKMRMFLERQPGVERVEILTQVRLNLHSVERAPNGLPHFAVCDPSRHTTASGPASLVMDDEVARRLGAKIGARFQFETRDGTVEAVLVETRKLAPSERVWSPLKLDCSGLDESSLFHYAAVAATPGDASAVRREILASYSTLGVMTAEELSETVSATAKDAMKLARIVTWYAIGSGLCILIAAVSASQVARFQEIGILSAIGARPRTIFKIYTVEFAAIGLGAGIIATLLSCGFTTIATSVISHRIEPSFEWKAAAIAVIVAPILTAIGGWLPVYRFLQRRPLEALRDK